MHARPFTRVALAVALSSTFDAAAFAGGRGGGHGGAVFHPAGGFGGRGGWGRARALPPVAGVIHERAGTRPYVSAYGHTDTALRFGGFARGGVPGYGHTATALPYGGAYRFSGAGYGHLGTGLRIVGRGRFGEARRRFDAGRGFAGGFGGGYGFGAGFYGAPGFYGDAGTYGGQGIYGQPGTYGGEGTYGGSGTTATQSVYGGGAVGYRSETPLAARYAEPPLAPSPGAPYSPGDRYANAASADAGPAPRVVNPFRPTAGGCACGSSGVPVVYRYGVGTAY